MGTINAIRAGTAEIVARGEHKVKQRARKTAKGNESGAEEGLSLCQLLKIGRGKQESVCVQRSNIDRVEHLIEDSFSMRTHQTVSVSWRSYLDQERERAIQLLVSTTIVI